MSLQLTGVELVAKGAAAFINTMSRANTAASGFGLSAKRGSQGISLMNIAMGNLVSRGITGVTRAVGKVGRATTGFFTDGIGMAMDLEVQMDTIAAVMGKTDEEASVLRETVSDLGLDPNLKVTSLEAAEAIEYLARNGISMEDVMGGAAKSTILLSNATGADFVKSANVATSAMQVFGIEANEMDGAINSIVGGINNSKFTLNDYDLALRNGGAAANFMGDELDDFVAVITASAEEMGTGRKAGTGYNNFLKQIQPTTKNATAAMRELGIITDEGNKFIDKATGQYVGAAKASEVMAEALSGTYEVTEEVNGRTAEQNNLLDKMQLAYNKAANNVQDYTVGIKGANLSDADRTKAIDKQRATMAALSPQIEELNGIRGEMVTTTKTLTKAEIDYQLRQFTGNDAFKTAIALADEGKVIYTDLATASEELGISQDILNNYIEDGITGFEAIQAAIDTVDAEQQGAQRINNAAGALEVLRGVAEEIQIQFGNEFLPVIQETAVAFTEFLTENKEGILEFFSKFSEKIIGFSEAAREAFLGGESPFQVMMAGLSGAGVPEDTIESIENFAEKIKELGNWLIDKGAIIVEYWDTILVAIMAWRTISIITGLITTLSAAFTLLLSPIGLALIVIGIVVVAIAALYWAWTNNFMGIQEKTAAIWDTIKEKFDIAMEFISTKVNTFLEKVKGWWEVHGENVMTIVNAFKDKIVAGFELLKTIVQTVIKKLVDNAKLFWEMFGTAIKRITNGFIEQIGLLFEGFKETIEQIIKAIALAIEGDWEGFGANMRAATETWLTALRDLFVNAQVIFANAIVDVANAVIAKWKETDWASLGQNLIDGFLGGLEAARDYVMGKVSGFFKAVIGAAKGALLIDSPSKVFYGIGENVVQGFLDALTDGESTITNAVAKTFNFTSMLGGLASEAGTQFKKKVLDPLENEAAYQDEQLTFRLGFANKALERSQIGEEASGRLDAKRRALSNAEQELARLENRQSGGNLTDIQRKLTISARKEQIKDMFESLESDLKDLNLDPFDTLSSQERVSLWFKAIRDGNDELKKSIDDVWDAQNRRNAAEAEYKNEQQKILDIQEKQQSIGFLKSQLDLFKFVQENKLNAGELFKGMAFGADADPAAILSATASALDQVISGLSSALSPQVQGPNGGTSNTNTSNTNVSVNGTFQGQAPPLIASSIEAVLAGV